MAGDWIKVENNTPDKPEVLAITVQMGWDDPDLTVGKLFRVWRWFDQHTTNGNAVSVTFTLLDRIAGVTGFAKAMESVGWLVIDDQGVSLPNFDRHCGKTAKDRAQTAKRVAEHKQKRLGNDEGNAVGVTTALPREEKRREEEIGEKEKEEKKTPRKRVAPTDSVARPESVDEQTWADWLSLRAKKKAPVTATVLREAEQEAAKAQMTLQRFFAVWCVRGSQGLSADWLKPHERGKPEPQSKHAGFASKSYREGVETDGSLI